MDDCKEYGLAMRLQALRKRLSEEDLDLQEKEEIEKEIRALEQDFEK